MKDLEIWKIYQLNFDSSGLLVSNFGRIKRFDWGDRSISDNGAGYKKAAIHNLSKDKKFTDQAVIQDSNGAVRSAIGSTPGGFGYVDAAYVDKTIKALSYDGVTYSIQAVIDGKYPIYTFGRMFTKGEPTGATKVFIDYVTSAKFQEAYAEKNGFIPVTKMKK